MGEAEEKKGKLHTFIDFIGYLHALLRLDATQRDAALRDPDGNPFLHVLELLRILRSHILDEATTKDVSAILEQLADENEVFIDLATLLLDSRRIPSRCQSLDIIGNLTLLSNDFINYFGCVHEWLVRRFPLRSPLLSVRRHPGLYRREGCRRLQALLLGRVLENVREHGRKQRRSFR